MEPILTVVIVLVALLIGLGAGYFIRRSIAEAKISSAEEAARQIVEEAKRDAEAVKKEKVLEAKDEVFKLRSEAENELRDRRNEIQRQERRILQKEESLDRKMEQLERKEEELSERDRSIAELQSKVEHLYKEQVSELERISGLTQDEAKNIILTDVENTVRHEMAVMIKEIETQAKEEADKRAREIITTSIQRCAADHVAETTVSVVTLPND